jgi:hypothetical protein
MRSIMEAYYEPQFSPTSHGFRPELGRVDNIWAGYEVWVKAIAP